MTTSLSCKPSAYYYRQALRSARTKREAVEIGLNLVDEIERHKRFIRNNGMIPPKWYIMQTEQDAKTAEVCPFPPTTPPSGMAG